MHKIGKKGSVIFLWIIVVLAIAALIFLLIKFSSETSIQNRYLIDNALKNSYFSFSSIAGHFMYFDDASELAGNKAAWDFGTEIIDSGNCLTESHLLKVSSSCNLKVSTLKKSFIQSFDKYFKEYYNKFPKSEKIYLGMSTPDDFEYYFFKNRFHIVSYDEVSLSGPESGLKTRISSEINTPVNFTEIYNDYKIAQRIDADCRLQYDYDDCVRSEIANIGWDMLSINDINEMPPLNSFMEHWLNCVDSSDINCSCSLGTNEFSNSKQWLGIYTDYRGVNFNLLNDEKIVKNIFYPFNLPVCNIHKNGVFDRTAIQMQKENEKIRVRVSNDALEEPKKWDSASVNNPELFVYKNQIGLRRACLLTTSEDRAKKVIKNQEVVVINKECKPAHDRLYVKIKSKQKLSKYSEKDLVEKNLVFYFVFEK